MQPRAFTKQKLPLTMVTPALGLRDNRLFIYYELVVCGFSLILQVIAYNSPTGNAQPLI